MCKKNRTFAQISIKNTMGDYFITNQIDATTFDIELFIDDNPDKSEMDKLLDDVIGYSRKEMDVVEYICAQEYSKKLSTSDSRELGDTGIVIGSIAYYGVQGEEEPEESTDLNPQAKDKWMHWNMLMGSMRKPIPCNLSLFIFYRDTMGNLRKLHSNNKELELTLSPSQDDTKVRVHIHSAHTRTMECGRYYMAFIAHGTDDRYYDQPLAVCINIVPPSGDFEVKDASLVGMEQVYDQMASVAKLKVFNDRRKAMNLPPSPVTLHAAVMGGKGSGKTSFAQILFDFYKKNGLITDGRLRIIEATRWLNFSESDEKIKEDVTKARNGILYIENAASMVSADARGNKEYAVQALVRELSENTHNTTVVLADTPEKITELLAVDNLQDYIGQIYHLPELNTSQMVEVAERECKERGFSLSPEAKTTLESLLLSQPNAATTDVIKIVDTMIMNMSVRVVNQSQERTLSPDELSLIVPQDVPQPQVGQFDRSMGKLNALVGLKKLKYNIESHLNLVRFAQLRSRNGLEAAMPPLHMIFTGNPGTGKTTVARLLGEIYASLGILKTGKVIVADRKKLVGRFIGDTEDNTKQVLQQAHGNILFIDEAYTLVGDPDDKKDFGPKVLDCLLEELGKEKTDMIIILAGYPDEMEKLLKANKGLQSRFPYTFHFEDYSEAELFEIAVRTAADKGYSFSEEAIERLKSLIRREMKRSTSGAQDRFGNARFITRLISTQILPNMSRRVLSMPAADTSRQMLSSINATDIPANLHTDYTPDEALISRTLTQLDEMVGLEEVKRSLRDIVTIARSKQQNGEDITETIPLQWTFTGSTGTGKSSVARLLAQLLHAFHLIGSDRMIQLRMPQTPNSNWTSYEIDKILRDTMKQAGQGLLFIDLDDVVNYHLDVQWLRCKLTSLTAEMPGSYAFVIAVDDRNLKPQPIDMPISTSIIHFSDYTADELMAILLQRLQKNAYSLTEEAQEEVRLHIQEICAKRSAGFANARTIRHICTAITSAAEIRMADSTALPSPVQITRDDIRSFTWSPLSSNRIGFGA